MKNISVFLDCAFFFVSFFILSFLILNYFISNTLALTVSISVSGLIAVVIFKILQNKKSALKIKSNEKQQKENAVLQLAFMSKTEIANLFQKALINSKSKYVKSGNTLFLSQENVYFYFAFSLEGLTKTDVLKAFNLSKNYKKLKIFCAKCSTEVLEFSLRFSKIEIMDGDKTYLFLKERNALPKPKYYLLENVNKKRFSFSKLLKKKRASKFLIFGLVFSIMSFFVYFKIYYVIVGAIGLILATTCRLFGATD